MKTEFYFKELNAYIDVPLEISGEIDLENELIRRTNRIVEASEIDVRGYITNTGGEYAVDLRLQVDLIVRSSRSLKPVSYAHEVDVSELYVTTPPSLEEEEDQEEVIFKIEDDFIDLKPIIVENIIVSLPTQVFTQEELEDNVMPEGENWVVISEDDYVKLQSEQNTGENSPFAKLKGIFPDEEDSSN